MTTLDFNALAQIHLIKGAGGGDPRKGLCIMEMVDYFSGSSHVSDRPACACPVLTEYAIRLNDSAPSQHDRDGLKPLLPLLSGSRDDAAMARRTEHVARETAHRIVAPLFDAGWPRRAVALRAARTMGEIRDAADVAAIAANIAGWAAVAKAAEAASVAAEFVEFAQASLAPAPLASYPDVAAAEDFVAAAVAAAEHVVAAAARPKIWNIRRAILVEAIMLGAHGDLDAPTFDARAERLRKLAGVAP